MFSIVKLTVLIENRSDNILLSEAGFSILIEGNEKNLLFDTGETGAFIDNAEKLNVNLDNLDAIAISHGHSDHSGGIKRLVKEYKNIPDLFVGKGFFENKYKLLKNKVKYLGNPFTESELGSINIKEVNNEVLEVFPDIYLMNGFNTMPDYESYYPPFVLKKDGVRYETDRFDDEIIIVIKTQKGLVVVVGCSHVGIVNILKSVKQKFDEEIYCLIGGTHLMIADDERIRKTIKDFKDLNIQKVCACHCTGDRAMNIMEEELKSRFSKVITGTTLIFD